MIDNKNILKNTIEKYKETTPILLVGEALSLFLKAYKHKTISIESDEELESIIEYYEELVPHTPLVIYDLSILSKKSLNKLLKFIEDFRGYLILGSTTDVFDSTLLSRIKSYIRFTTPITSNFLPISKGIETLDELDLESQLDINKHLQKYSPQLYYYRSYLDNRNKDKIISIIGGTYDRENS